MGERVGHKYTLLERLGEGAMGVVLRAVQHPLEREVAVKFVKDRIADDPQRLERFRREALACTRLSHPGIIKVLDFGEIDGKPFYSMELIQGAVSLDRVIFREGTMAVARVVHIAIQLLDALEYCHAQRLVHRDLKPGNVMLLTDDRAILMDFGLVKDHDASVLTRTGESVGSPGYMPPEVWNGELATEAADLWALGTMLYQMLSGDRPFPGDTLQVIARAIVKDEPRPIRELRPDVPVAVAEVVAALLLKDPARRIERARHLRGTLVAWQERGAVVKAANAEARERRASGATPTPVPPGRSSAGGSTAPPARERRPMALLLCTAVLAGAIGLGGLAVRRAAAPSPATSAALTSPSTSPASPPSVEPTMAEAAARLKARLDVVAPAALRDAMLGAASQAVRPRDAGERARLLSEAGARFTERVARAVGGSRLEEAVTALAGRMDRVYLDRGVPPATKLALHQLVLDWAELERLAVPCRVRVPAFARSLTSAAFGPLAAPRVKVPRGVGVILGDEPDARPPAAGPALRLGRAPDTEPGIRVFADPRSEFAPLPHASPPFVVLPGVWQPPAERPETIEVRGMVGGITRCRGMRVLWATDLAAPRRDWHTIAELELAVSGYWPVSYSVPADVLPDRPAHLRLEPIYDLEPAVFERDTTQHAAMAWLVLAW